MSVFNVPYLPYKRGPKDKPLGHATLHSLTFCLYLDILYKKEQV